MCILAVETAAERHLLTALHWAPSAVGDIVSVVEFRPSTAFTDAPTEVVVEKRDGAQLLWQGRFPVQHSACTRDA